MKLQELKKLTEKTAPAKHSSAVYHSFDNCDQWVGADGCPIGDADVECGFDGEPASHTDHPYGSTTAREHHGAYLDLESCVLQHDIDVYDDEGDKVIGKLTKGTDLMDQKWWDNDWNSWFEKKALDDLESSGKDYDY